LYLYLVIYFEIYFLDFGPGG